MPYVNNKDTGLISAFVVCCLDNIIPLVSISEISSLCLVPGRKPEDRFSHDVAHLEIYFLCIPAEHMVKKQKLQTPFKMSVFILKFEQCGFGFTIE